MPFHLEFLREGLPLSDDSARRRYSFNTPQGNASHVDLSLQNAPLRQAGPTNHSRRRFLPQMSVSNPHSRLKIYTICLRRLFWDVVVGQSQLECAIALPPLDAPNCSDMMRVLVQHDPWPDGRNSPIQQLGSKDIVMKPSPHLTV